MNNNFPISLQQELNNKSEDYIVFSINKKQYAIVIHNILEITGLPKIDIPSKTPYGIIGMLNYNGMIIKVVDLRCILGLEITEFSVNDRLIIAISDDTCFAIHCEHIENIVKIGYKNLQAVPFELENSIIKNIFQNDDNPINIIDINALNKLLTNNRSNENNINYEKLFPCDENSQKMLFLREQKLKSNQEAFSFPVNVNSVNQYILFSLNNHNYYLDLKYVKEFISIKRLNITKLPYTEDFVKGIINLKGDFLLVIDLKRFLNNDINNIQEGSKLIIAEGKDFNIAFLVDDIKYIKNLKNIQKSKTYSGISPYIYSEFIEDDELYSILNFEKIINDERLYININ